MRQAIHARLALFRNMDPCCRRSQLDRCAGGSNESMAKIIVVEKAVHVGTQNAARLAHSTVGYGLCFAVPFNIGQSPRPGFVKGFAYVDLVTGEI